MDAAKEQCQINLGAEGIDGHIGQSGEMVIDTSNLMGPEEEFEIEEEYENLNNSNLTTDERIAL